MRSLLIAVSTFALAACNFASDKDRDAESSGPKVEQSYNAVGFDKIVLAGSSDVVVTAGATASVRAEGDADMIKKLDIKVEDNTLKIGLKRGVHWDFDFGHHRSPVTVYVTTPHLASAAVAGSGDMRIDKVEGDTFSGSIAGSGGLDIASLRVGEAEFNMAGSGGLKAAGSVAKVKTSTVGSGSMDLAGVDSKAIEVAIVGSGDVTAMASETADVTILGSGDATIKGTAKCTIAKRGSGDAHCGG
jgi:hypothetical protein